MEEQDLNQVDEVQEEQQEVDTTQETDVEPSNPALELLDEISEDNPNDEEENAVQSESATPEQASNQDVAVEQSQQAQQTVTEQAKQDVTDNQTTEPSIEEEMLSGVKSERSKARIQQWINEHNQLRQVSSQIEQTNRQFADIVRGTGMNNEELAQTFEFCRLSRQDDEASLNLALEMLEQERQQIYARLGKTAPGNDALDGFDDLKQAVESMDIPLDKAKEMAELRRYKAMMQNQTQSRMQMQRQQMQQQQQYQTEISQFQQSAMQMFEGNNGQGGLRAVDPLYQQRVSAVGQWLKDGGQDWMIRNLPPQKWTEHLFNVYQQVKIQPATPQVQVNRSSSPLSGKPQTLNKPAIKGTTASEIVGSVFDNLGL